MSKLIIMLLVIIIFFIIYFKNKKIEYFSICGGSNLNRVDIWKNVKEKYGEKEALKIFPKTYMLPEDLIFINGDKNKQFILKTLWSGGRRGVDLYDDKKKIFNDYKKYDVAQVYIKNPLLINGFKFNIRFFLLTYCGVGNFLYVNGYNTYTKNKFDYNSLNRHKKINQAFTDDIHYKQNNLPITIKDLEKYLNINFTPVLNTLVLKLNKIIKSCKNLCCKNDINNFKIFGLDIELLDNLDPIVIEINSQPHLKFDIIWKKNIINDMLEDIKYKKFINNYNWIKI